MPNTLQFLLIDDDLDDHEIFWMAIQQACPGASCFFARNCAEASIIVRDGTISNPDFLFLDWNFPQTTASHCITELSRTGALQSTVIVILSGAIPLIDDEEMGRLGIRKILKKQNSIDLLASEFRELLVSR